MKQTIYIETTIVSYLTARPSRDLLRRSHDLLTRKWWATRHRSFDLYTSIFTVEEAARGDPKASAERKKALQGIPLLPVGPEVTVLAELLAHALKLPARSRIDAAHLAVSAVYGMAFLLTWNCRHLANGFLTDKIEKVCDEEGFTAPRILTPEMLMELS